jgi:iron complex transport system ATP-binding protein
MVGMPAPPPPTLVARDVEVRRDGRRIQRDIDLVVAADERWVVLGPNGSGKTTLLRILASYEHPSAGTVDVLGERLGRVDVRELRRRVGYASAALAAQLRPGIEALDVVRTARFAALEAWWHRYTADDDRRALACLARMGVEALAHRTFGTLSSGEQQRVLLARTLMNDPSVVLLDEPSARLDLGGREELLATLGALADDAEAPALVMVTHHVEEIPRGITHVLLLRDGGIVASGPIAETLTAAALSNCFGLELRLERRADGRFGAWAT